PATSPLPCPVDESHAADVSTVAAKAAHSVMHDTGAAVAAADAGLERTYAFDAAELPTEPELDLPDANGIYYSALLIAVDKHFVNALGLPVSATQEQKQAQVDVTCAAYTMAMNIILQNSQVDNLRWALVGTVIAPDDFSNQSISSSLDEMAYFGAKYQDGSPVNPSEKMGGPARREASKLGADQILFIAGAYITGDHAGIAVQSADDDNRFSPYATAYDVFGVKTFAHELGHTFGLRHDRVTDNVPDNNGKYYYGYEWYLPDLNNNSALASNGDVMSYAANPVAYFSNPQIELNNADVAMGHYQFPAGTSRIGVPASEAKAADASRWLREKARQMASFRKSLVFLYNPPGSTAVAPGSMLTLSALATVGRTDLGNDDKISYQWFFNNFPITSIASGTTRALTIPSVSAANAGTYHVRATSMGEVTVLSTSAVVSVTSGLPVIASHPQSVSVAKGGILTLSASVSGSNLAFQWKRNGVAITGANSPTYTKTGVTDADEGTYTLTVSNDSGSVTSQPATVTVTGGSDGGNDNGGGGGAPGTLYLVLLASLIVIKFIRGK
ncbi:immunoglobulin domain-containing protein, partial [Termitidicoccus mucosus]|uniref:immunoglobulin domain-containing protein n=1 Tax=Termitidicoccus mucosus TaxID=1184151 RepID=UPI000A5F077F